MGAVTHGFRMLRRVGGASFCASRLRQRGPALRRAHPYAYSEKALYAFSFPGMIECMRANSRVSTLVERSDRIVAGQRHRR